MKNFYIAVQIEEDGKLYAYVVKVSSSDNLLSKLTIKNIITANICKTKKEAIVLVENWNERHKTNNRHMFVNASF